MKTPCKDCLILPICKNRILLKKHMHGSSSAILYVSCGKFRDCFEFYRSQGLSFATEFEKVNKKIFGSNYNSIERKR